MARSWRRLSQFCQASVGLDRNWRDLGKIWPVLANVWLASAEFGRQNWWPREADLGRAWGSIRPTSAKVGPGSAEFGPTLAMLAPSVANFGPESGRRCRQILAKERPALTDCDVYTAHDPPGGGAIITSSTASGRERSKSVVLGPNPTNLAANSADFCRSHAMPCRPWALEVGRLHAMPPMLGNIDKCGKSREPRSRKPPSTSRDVSDSAGAPEDVH